MENWKEYYYKLTNHFMLAEKHRSETTWEWVEEEYLKPPERQKLVAKIPMSNKVIDKHGNIWQYFIQNKKVEYIYYATTIL